MVLVISGTGHRPQKLPGGFDNYENNYSICKHIIKKQLEKLSPDKILSGMALGWDMALADVAKEMRIPYTCVIAFPGVHWRWKGKDQKLFETLLSLSSSVHYITLEKPSTYPEVSAALYQRNLFLMDNCDKVLALYQSGSMGGTAYAIKYAKSKQLEIINCWESFISNDTKS